MDLNTILKNTKKVKNLHERSRDSVYIAKKDRPYDISMPPTGDNFQKKVTTNHEQSVNKVVTKPTTKCKQSDYNLTVNSEQSDYITENNVLTNYKQSVNKVATNCSFSALVGIQQLIVTFIYNECKKSRSKITQPLTLSYISSQIKIEKKSIKTSIYRLSNKGYIFRRDFKNGRGGWTRYELSKEVFHELLQLETDNKLTTKHEQSVNKVVSKPTTKLTTNSSSSSTNKETTTTELPNIWKEINLKKIKEKIGFTKTHLTQLYKSGQNNPEQIKSSIEYFLFDLENNGKLKAIKTNPLSYFMGILRRNGVYTAPTNYESEKDQATRLYLEREEALAKKRKEMEERLLKVEFEKWLSNLEVSQKQSLLSENSKKSNKFPWLINTELKQYFRENLWPNLSKEIMKKIS